MREADFGTVDSAIARCLNKSEVFGILWIDDDAVDSFLQKSQQLLRTMNSGVPTLMDSISPVVGGPQRRSMPLSRDFMRGCNDSMLTHPEWRQSGPKKQST